MKRKRCAQTLNNRNYSECGRKRRGKSVKEFRRQARMRGSKIYAFVILEEENRLRERTI